jgi:hypothetical protein
MAGSGSTHRADVLQAKAQRIPVNVCAALLCSQLLLLGSRQPRAQPLLLLLLLRARRE